MLYVPTSHNLPRMLVNQEVVQLGGEFVTAWAAIKAGCSTRKRAERKQCRMPRVFYLAYVTKPIHLDRSLSHRSCLESCPGACIRGERMKEKNTTISH